jgi:hypothetical protein
VVIAPRAPPDRTTISASHTRSVQTPPPQIDALSRVISAEALTSATTNATHVNYVERDTHKQPLINGTRPGTRRR